MDAYIPKDDGCEFFCEICAPENCEVYSDGGGESDVPEHCAHCGEPLGNSLTSHGVQYVLEAIRDSLRDGETVRNTIRTAEPKTADEPRARQSWYAGSRQCAVVRDWAEDLKNYGGLSKRDQRLIEIYLAWTAEKTPVAN